MNSALLELKLLHNTSEPQCLGGGQTKHNLISPRTNNFIVPPNTPVKIPMQLNPRYISKVRICFFFVRFLLLSQKPAHTTNPLIKVHIHNNTHFTTLIFHLHISIVTFKKIQNHTFCMIKHSRFNSIHSKFVRVFRHGFLIAHSSQSLWL